MPVGRGGDIKRTVDPGYSSANIRASDMLAAQTAMGDKHAGVEAVAEELALSSNLGARATAFPPMTGQAMPITTLRKAPILWPMAKATQPSGPKRAAMKGSRTRLASTESAGQKGEATKPFGMLHSQTSGFTVVLHVLQAIRLPAKSGGPQTGAHAR